MKFPATLTLDKEDMKALPESKQTHLIECLERTVEKQKVQLRDQASQIEQFKQGSATGEDAPKLPSMMSIITDVREMFENRPPNFHDVLTWIKENHYPDYEYETDADNLYFHYNRDLFRVDCDYAFNLQTLGTVYFPESARSWLPELQRLIDSKEITL